MSFHDTLQKLEFGASRANAANLLRAAPPAAPTLSKLTANLANQPDHANKLASLATPLLSPQASDSAAFSKLAGLAASSEKNLSDDFKLVSTWWQWSPDDAETFKSWAARNRDEAAAWVHQEAAVVRDYRDRLHVASVTELIGLNCVRNRSE